MTVVFDYQALRQWADKRDLPAGEEMARLFPHLCDDVVGAADRIEELERLHRAEHGPSYGAGGGA